MVRQDPGVDHVRITQHDVCAAANRPARVLRRVAVVGEDANRRRALLGLEQFDEPVQFGQLVLRKRLGRKQVQRARRRVLEDRVDDRRVVAQRLPRRRRRDRDDVPAGKRVRDCVGLVRVKLVDPAGVKGAREPRVEHFGKGREARRHRVQALDGRDVRVLVAEAQGRVV